VNILVDIEGHAKLADFGLTHVGDVTTGRMSTHQTGHGSARWMSPERIKEDGDVRIKDSDDVYSFGCLIYSVSCSRFDRSRHSCLCIMMLALRGEASISQPQGNSCSSKSHRWRAANEGELRRSS
jgi:serine/threonine protein kinase